MEGSVDSASYTKPRISAVCARRLKLNKIPRREKNRILRILNLLAANVTNGLIFTQFDCNNLVRKKDGRNGINTLG